MSSNSSRPGRLRAAHSSIATIASNSRTRSSWGDGEWRGSGTGPDAASSSGESRARSATQGSSSGGAPWMRTSPRRSSAQRPNGAPPPRSRPAHHATAAPSARRRLDQLRGDSGLADPSLSGERDDAAMAAPGLTPDLDQGLELGDPARERVTVTEWHRIIARLDPGQCPLRPGRVRSAEVTSQSPRLLGRADPELGTKTRSKLVVGVSTPARSPAAASIRIRSRTPSSESGIECHPTPSPADRRDAILTGVGLGRQLGEHGAQLALLLLARLEHPLLVEVAEQPAATEIDSAGPIAGREPPPELPEIGSHRRREPDSLTRRLELGGRRAKRRPQSPAARCGGWRARSNRAPRATGAPPALGEREGRDEPPAKRTGCAAFPAAARPARPRPRPPALQIAAPTPPTAYPGSRPGPRCLTGD